MFFFWGGGDQKGIIWDLKMAISLKQTHNFDWYVARLSIKSEH